MSDALKQMSRDVGGKPWNLSSRSGSAVGSAKGRVLSFFDPNAGEACVTVCNPKGKCECGCQAVKKALQEEIEERKLNIKIANMKVGCSGKCENGAFLGFPQKGFFYVNVKPENIAEIVEESFIKGYVLFPYISVNPERSYRTDLLFEKESGMIGAIDDQVCMVQVAKYFLEFEEGLSCGKCPPCRIGIKRMQESVDRIIGGKGTEKDLQDIELLCNAMIDTPYCSFAMFSTKPVLSALKYFRDEFKAHVDEQECVVGLCSELVEIQKKKARRRRK
jgi:(2Fe-2S) ferredoxin